MHFIVKDTTKRVKNLNKWQLKNEGDPKLTDQIMFIDGSVHELNHYISMIKSAICLFKGK